MLARDGRKKHKKYESRDELKHLKAGTLEYQRAYMQLRREEASYDGRTYHEISRDAIARMREPEPVVNLDQRATERVIEVLYEQLDEFPTNIELINNLKKQIDVSN